MQKKVMSIKNDSKIRYTAKQISNFFNRGSAIAGKIETVLKSLRELGLKSLKNLNEEHIQNYVEQLQEKAENGELTTKTTSTYISALNDILRYTERENLIISAKEHGLSRGSFVYTNKANTVEAREKFLSFLHEKDSIQHRALAHSVELQRQFGLRLRESISIKKETIRQAIKTGVLHLTRKDGTKNGQSRSIKIETQEQKETLQKTVSFMQENNLKSLIPTQTRQEHVNFAYSVVKEFKQQTSENFHFHGERHAFAQEYYNRLTQQGVDEKEARLQVSEVLGHHRKDITVAYLGK